MEEGKRGKIIKRTHISAASDSEKIRSRQQLSYKSYKYSRRERNCSCFILFYVVI
jgi:hypothetical protein